MLSQGRRLFLFKNQEGLDGYIYVDFLFRFPYNSEEK